MATAEAVAKQDRGIIRNLPGLEMGHFAEGKIQPSNQQAGGQALPTCLRNGKFRDEPQAVRSKLGKCPFHQTFHFGDRQTVEKKMRNDQIVLPRWRRKSANVGADGLQAAFCRFVRAALLSCRLVHSSLQLGQHGAAAIDGVGVKSGISR